MEDFLFPASKVLLDLKQGVMAEIAQNRVIAVCQTTDCINAAYDLLVALCTGCVDNLQTVSHFLTKLFYHGTCLIPNSPSPLSSLSSSSYSPSSSPSSSPSLIPLIFLALYPPSLIITRITVTHEYFICRRR